METDLATYKSLLFSNIWCHYWRFQLGQQVQHILWVDSIQEIAKYFHETLIHNKYRVENLQREWIVLKTIVKAVYENDTEAKYLDIFKPIFSN